jgi:hypothetical protein
VLGAGVEVRVPFEDDGGAGNRPLQAVRKMVRSMPQEKIVSFIGKSTEAFLRKLLYNQLVFQPPVFSHSTAFYLNT